MKIKRKFIYNDDGKEAMYFAIAYGDKNFYLQLYSDDGYLNVQDSIKLFPVKRYSDGSKRIAFDVANLYVIPSRYLTQ